MNPVLELRSIGHAYDGVPVVSGLSLSLERGAIGCLLGPSGCGKTTILRCIAGFETLTAGEIRINGRLVDGAGVRVPTEQRNVGVVFQDYALFPHLTVEANLGFGLHRWSAADRERRTREMLELIDLAGLGKRYPHEISGGQQQRVALARALAPQPDLLLMDEPFSNLDVDLRERLGQEVRDILKQQQTTALLVTHDQHEAFAMADEVGVMSAGRIQQWDRASNLYRHPANRFVAGFIGRGTFLPAVIAGQGRVETELGSCLVAAVDSGSTGAGERACEVLLRPEDLLLDEHGAVQARVVGKVYRGADVLHTLELPSGSRVTWIAAGGQELQLDEYRGVRLRPGAFAAFPK